MQMIADSLGVSKNTVSQALRGKNGVSDATRHKIISRANELGYQFEPQRRNKRTFLIIASSFAISQVSFFGKIINSIKAQLDEKHDQYEIITITDEMISNQELPSNISHYNGVFVISHITNDYISKIISCGLPTILVDHHYYGVKADCILTKNSDGAYEMTNHLIQAGAETIGFLGKTDFSPSYKERLRGYLDALKANQIEPNSEHIVTDIEENQLDLFTKLKNIPKMPKAWFCVNSGLAYILNIYLQSNGFAVPNDIQIACFDNTEFSTTSNPRITNISTDLDYMGKIAVKRMAYRLEHPHTPYEHQQIIPQLNLFESTKI